MKIFERAQHVLEVKRIGFWTLHCVYLRDRVGVYLYGIMQWPVLLLAFESHDRAIISRSGHPANRKRPKVAQSTLQAWCAAQNFKNTTYVIVLVVTQRNTTR